jgi:hypothetical protein
MTRLGTTPGDRRALRNAHAKAVPDALFLEPGVNQLFEEDRSVMMQDKELANRERAYDHWREEGRQTEMPSGLREA